MTVAIVVGHHKGSQGAESALGLTEWQIGHVLARQVVNHLDCGRLFAHEWAGSTEATLQRTIRAVNAAKPLAVVELHWNSVGQRTASGQRLIDWDTSFGIAWAGSKKGARLAKAAGDACAHVIEGSRPYEVRFRNSGYPMLRDTKPPACLLETHNGRNEAVHVEYLEAVQSGRLAREIARSIDGVVRGWVA